MLNAHELDSQKFPSSIFDIQKEMDFQKLIQEVKHETASREAAQVNMLFNITDALVPKKIPEIEWQNEFEEIIAEDREKFNIILRVVSDVSGTGITQIKSMRKFVPNVIARSVIIFLTRWTTTLTLKNIGRAIMNAEPLDHTTVLYSSIKVKEAIQIKDEKVFPILMKSIITLKEYGIKVDLIHQQPDWYKMMLKKMKNKMKNSTNQNQDLTPEGD